MQALDPTEVRRRLASDEEFDVEDIISEDDEDDLLQSLLGTEPSTMSDVEAAQKNIEQGQAPGGEEQSATVAPTATPPDHPMPMPPTLTMVSAFLLCRMAGFSAALA